MVSKNSAEIKKMCEVVARLNNADEVAQVFEDICTIQEIISMSQRLQVASLLDKGMNYSEINEITGVSSATISRVNRCLNYGSGGYKIALDLMKEEENAD